MAAEGDNNNNNIVRFTYTGRGEIPDEATHIFVDATVIDYAAFEDHPNIIEVICHERVEKIEGRAFWECPS